ncbi:His Kinase A (phospho-acceptor) domain-containing protein [Marinobacterium sediminicola]|uniref:histidine kinase n=2 Tax=Marinobacterium sediminicola TaxID=518898 RepID=A0ABY1RZ01_9GAMM|nr:His Kinase A (phospho-acceptor) domain-containing protein [Marinobacterium sediminicola]
MDHRMLQSEKLATLGKLTSGVAHELNNPVCYVKTNLQTLQHYTGNLDQLLSEVLELVGTTGNAEMVSAIKQLKQKFDYEYLHDELPILLSETSDGLNRVEEILSTLRDFVRNDADDARWVELNPLIDAALKLVHHELKYVVTAVRKCYGDIPPIWGHPSQLSQVIINVLVNAAQAMPKGGDIEVSTRLLEAENMIEICVCDQGEGIADEIMPLLFEPFVTSKPSGEGTGLGLSVSHQIIKHHQGSISATNREGGGACFSILLPVTAGD